MKTHAYSDLPKFSTTRLSIGITVFAVVLGGCWVLGTASMIPGCIAAVALMTITLSVNRSSVWTLVELSVVAVAGASIGAYIGYLLDGYPLRVVMGFFAILGALVACLARGFVRGMIARNPEDQQQSRQHGTGAG